MKFPSLAAPSTSSTSSTPPTPALPDPLLAIQEEMAQRLEARQSILPFTQLFTPDYHAGWVHREVAELLDAFMEAVARKKSPRLMIFLPPRAGKSQLISRLFPPFILGHHPEWEVVATSATQDLADQFGRYVRSILNDPIYQDLFPKLELDPSTNSASLIQTRRRGMYKAVGVGGQLTGMGAHVLVIDDPIKDREAANSPTQREALWEWYSSVARTRLHPGGGVVVVHTRWHEDDLAGKLILQMKENPDADQWKVYSYPAIAKHDEPHRKAGEALHPERFSVEELLKTKNSLLPADWASLYQQDPSPEDGDYFQRAWFDRRPAREFPPQDACAWYVACDLAVTEKQTADFSVIWPFCVDSAGDIWFSHDFIRARLPAGDIIDAVLDRVHRYKARGVIIEKGQILNAIKPFLNKRMMERQTFVPLIEPAATKDKLTRARSLQGRMQQKRVHFPDTRVFQDDVLSEFLMFPNGKHDDAVDACAWAALCLEDLITPHAPTPAKHPRDVELEQWAADEQAPKAQNRHVPKPMIAKPRRKLKENTVLRVRW